MKMEIKYLKRNAQVSLLTALVIACVGAKTLNVPLFLVAVPVAVVGIRDWIAALNLEEYSK